jgi:meso-butanediol dehydrogenase/(S,S)-butanediol dehydrogenase/diacetyl reductase
VPRSALVLVTGAAGAIGAATVRCFLDAGFAVAGLDRAPEVTAVVGEGYRGFAVDLADEPALARALADACAVVPLRHVVAIAGGALPGEPASDRDPLAMEPALFRASIEANLVTQFLTSRAALPWLRRSPGTDRSLTYTSSFNALAGWGLAAYSAAKAGLIGLMHATTGPLGAEGIRVNVVAPGTIRTPRTERLWGHVPGHFERLEAGTALDRLGTPEDVARAFVALASTLSHVSGQVLVVDGGQMVKRGGRTEP